MIIREQNNNCEEKREAEGRYMSGFLREGLSARAENRRRSRGGGTGKDGFYPMKGRRPGGGEGRRILQRPP